MTEQLNEELVIKRYSCRTYADSALSRDTIRELNEFIDANHAGPFGSKIRFRLTAAGDTDRSSLKDLGTYGVIKNPAAFIIGAVEKSGMYLEDFGYAMERIILKVTAMDLGTCWLGGSFRKSGFASEIGLAEHETVPAVASLGYIADKEKLAYRIMGMGPGSKKRKPGSRLFFDGNIRPLVNEPGEGYGRVLEMVRLAPSANNKQPWRVVKDDSTNTFRFYLDRSALYQTASRVLKLADMQRIDMGIAMCHFELAARDNNLSGSWKVESDPVQQVPGGWEYVSTWLGR